MMMDTNKMILQSSACPVVAQRQQGAVLIYILTFLAVMSLFGLTVMNGLMEQTKLSQTSFAQLESFALGLSGLTLVERQVEQHDFSCLNKSRYAAFYPHKFLAQDANEACRNYWHNHPIYYFVEKIQTLPCSYTLLKAKNKMSYKLGMEAYRVTVGVKQDERFFSQVFQSTYFSNSQAAIEISVSELPRYLDVLACEQTALMTTGRKSWWEY